MQFESPIRSQDLINEFFLLNKEVDRRGIGLHTLWGDNEEGSSSLCLIFGGSREDRRDDLTSPSRL